MHVNLVVVFIVHCRKHRKSRILNPPNNTEMLRSVSVPADRTISKSTQQFNPVTAPVTPDLEYVPMPVPHYIRFETNLTKEHVFDYISICVFVASQFQFCYVFTNIIFVFLFFVVVGILVFK